MLKRSRMLLITVFLSGALFLAVPGLAAAGDAVSYRAAEIVTVVPPQHGPVDLGYLVIAFDPLAEGEHSAEISLPAGFSVMAPGLVQAEQDPHVTLTASSTGQPNEFRVHIDYVGRSRQLTFVVPVTASIPEVTGDVRARITGLYGLLPDGEVVLARILKGRVSITSSTGTYRIITPEAEVPFVIEIAEDRGDVLRAAPETLKFILPERFAWQESGLKTETLTEGGFSAAARVDGADPRVLYVDIERQAERTRGSFTLSGTVKPERTLLPGAELRITASGVDLSRPVAVMLARVIEPQLTAWFTVGRNDYYSGGSIFTMDVVPYTKEGRLFLPLRYVGLSLGVESQNIKWDGYVATLVGEKVTVRVQPGSRQLRVNGSVVQMDTAAEVSQGRVMLPYRFIAEAFGADVDWNPATRTATMELW